MDYSVRNNPDRSRYEVHAGDDEAGYVEYERDGDTVTFTHTVVHPAYEGQGVAGRLVQQALDDVRSAGQRVVAQCSYVRGWIAKHPEYADLVERAA